MGMALKIIGGVVALLLVVAIGGWVALQRPDIPYDTLQSRYANAASRYVDLPGGLHVHYRDQGDPNGSVVLLVHGFGMSLDTWEPWVRLLGRSHRIVTLDLPGFGLTRSPAGARFDVESYGPVVEAFAKALNLNSFVIGGSSMGGEVAWRYALAHPERLKGLILADASGWPEPPGADPGDSPLSKILDTPIGRVLLINLDSHAILRDGLRQAFADPARATPAFVSKYVDLSRAPERRRVWLDLMTRWSQQHYATPQALAAIKVPTLILWGDKDQLVPLDSGRRFVAAIPGAHLIVYPKVGHLPEEEAAEASAADVGAFLHALDPVKKPAPGSAAAKTATPTVQVKPTKNLLVFY